MNTKQFPIGGPNSARAWTLSLAAAILSGLLAGIEPVGGDPDRMYRPLKAELARTFAEGRSPYWSDRLGLGFPLVAESHAAAFYPPNQVLYRVLSVPVAYRLSMFFHHLLMAGATFAYARRLGLSPDGSALAALAFTFCGFQAIHSSHEVFYHALAYLPLCLLAAEGLMAEGGLGWAAALAASFGLQLSVGHFQVQSWTAGLVLATAACRSVESPRRARRLPLAIVGLAWGAAMAAVQLGPTWELARFMGYDSRAFQDLAFFGFPPAHWAEMVVPAWLRGIPGGPEAGYWYGLGTTGYEACIYVGTIPLVFAFLGLLTGGRGVRLWIVVAAATFALAALPTLSLPTYHWVTTLPGLGLFRAPGRFLALTCLGLALLAGRGFDEAVGRRAAWAGLAFAALFALAGFWWVVSWSWRPDHVRVLAGDRLLVALGIAAVAWAVSLAGVALWLKGRLPAKVLLVASAAELGALYYTATTEWGWAVDVPGSSPILTKLAEEKDVGKVVGLLSNLPLRFGVSPLLPYTGFKPPPPHQFFEVYANRNAPLFGTNLEVLRSYGVTHGLWDGPVDPDAAETLMLSRDEALDRLVHKPPGSPEHASWRLVRFKGAWSVARAYGKAKYLPPGSPSYGPSATTVRYQVDRPPPPGLRPNAARAAVTSWDGVSATVEHDGPCDVVVNRTFYPGWTYSVDDGSEQPVMRAEDGIQSGHVPGAGTHRVSFRYRPTNLLPTVVISGSAVLLAAVTLGLGLRRRLSTREQDPAGQHDGP